jgi:hypothetical protein
MSKRELDLGRLAQKVGRRIEDEGQATSQRFHDWKRTEQIAADSTRGGGGVEQDRSDREASRLAAEWMRVRVQLQDALQRAAWLMDQAKAEHRQLDKHRTPAQVEADGWCGAHWHAVKALVPITLRSSGEPYYKGRCRFCGSWPGGDPPADVLRTRQAQRAAS